MKSINAILHVTALCIIIAVFAGCGSKRVNLRTLPPEEQFDYAKKFYDKKDYFKAKTEFTAVVMNNRGNRIAEAAQFYLAESHYNLKEYILAIAEYERLIRTMPKSQYVDDASYKIGMAYYELAPGYALDQEYTLKAISQFEQFLLEYPDSDLKDEVIEKWNVCKDKLAKKEFKAGEQYRKMGYFKAAIISFDAVIMEYPECDYVDDALYWKAECNRLMDNLDEAESNFGILIRHHSESEWVDNARDRIKAIEAQREKEESKSES